VSSYEDRFNDENKSSPEKEAIPPSKNIPVTAKNNEDTEPQNSEPQEVKRQTKKVWKKKETTPSDTLIQEEQPSESLSAGLENAPED
jgi:hypothetical protein